MCVPKAHTTLDFLSSGKTQSGRNTQVFRQLHGGSPLLGRTVKKLDIQIIFQDKLKFYLPESLLYKINNPDAEFLIHIGIVLLVIVLIVLLIGDQI